MSGDLASPRSSHDPFAVQVAGASRDTVLSALGVRRSFRMGERKLEILHGVDLQLERGDLLALVGKSGAGKSTLLHILGLLDRPSEGTVLVHGEDAWKQSPARRARLRNQEIGFVFQFYHLVPELDATENVLLPAMIASSTVGYLGKKRELVARAKDMLDRFGMGSRLTHRPNQLSGGERQRVAMARALFHDPEILLADEPTGNLDSATGERVLELLFEEQRRRRLSMILVTHDERLARSCGRRLSMRDGVLVDAAAG